MRRVLEAFESPSTIGLICNLLAVWAILFVSLVVLAKSGNGMGAETDATPRSAPWTPPGAFIGAMWSVLYTLMALALWRINAVSTTDQFSLKLWVIALVAFCIVWPFYAFDTPSRWPGLLGNLGIFALAVIATLRLYPHSATAAFMILPSAVWITIATATILDGARRYGW